MSSLPVVVQFSDRSVSFHFDGMLSEQIAFLMQIAEELTVCEFQLLKVPYWDSWKISWH